MTPLKPVIGTSEAVTLLFIFLSSKTFLAYAVFLYDEGLNAAWVIPLMQTAIGLLSVLVLAALLEKFPGRDLVEIGEELAGPYVNTLFALFYLAVFLFGAGMVLRLVSERMVSGFFINTPISLVTLFFVIGALVVSYLGLEAVARTARFLVGILVVSAMVLVVLTLPLWQLHSLYPLWGPGPWGLIKEALKNSGDFVQILLLGIIYPFLPPGKVKLIGIKGVIIAGFFMFLYVLAPLMIFSYPATVELTMPSFEMARIINIGRFGQRLEIVFLPVWVFGNLITLSTALYAGAAIITRMFKLSDYRPFVLAVTVLTVVIAFVPENFSQALDYNHKYLSHYSFVVLAFILSVLYGVAWLRGRGKEESRI